MNPNYTIRLGNIIVAEASTIEEVASAINDVAKFNPRITLESLCIVAPDPIPPPQNGSEVSPSVTVQPEGEDELNILCPHCNRRSLVHLTRRSHTI